MLTVMSGKFRTQNIREYFDNPVRFAELENIIASFSCPRNNEVESFLKNNAIDFTKQNKSATYLVFSCEDDSLTGYFSVIIKPLDVFTETLSNSFRKRVAGFSKYNEGNRTYLTAAYLIAQLGKNFTDGTDKKISGDELLNEA